ncbi:MAG: glycosyltransferase family 9 protein [Verrucomicrobiales bacterium]|nr:glycosyltransferase family 9 protein [Verrucomicrobiales bacterium]
MELKGSERILVVKPSSLGDIVHALPAVAAIKRQYPGVKIDWLANTEWTPILEGSPSLENVIPFPRRQLRGLPGLFRAKTWAGNELKPLAYDLAIDFQGLLRSALLSRLSGAKKVIGFQEAREGAPLFYDRKIHVPDWHRTHAIDRNRALVDALGIETAPVDFALPAGLPLEPEPVLDAPALLLHPFSRGVGKSLSKVEVRELCEALSPIPVWLAGVADTKLASEEWPENVTSFLNKTSLPQLIHLLRSASWTVSVDSGPMHLAAGINDRILSIHTWSDPLMVGPWHPNAWIWRNGQIREMKSISPGEFPEERSKRGQFESRTRTLSSEDISALAVFLKPHLHS